MKTKLILENDETVLEVSSCEECDGMHIGLTAIEDEDMFLYSGFSEESLDVLINVLKEFVEIGETQGAKLIAEESAVHIYTIQDNLYLRIVLEDPDPNIWLEYQFTEEDAQELLKCAQDWGKKT